MKPISRTSNKEKCIKGKEQINYPSFKHNTQDSIEQARGRSHEEVSSQIFMFLLCLSVFIGRGRENHPALSCHGVGQGGVGRLCVAAPAFVEHGFLLLLVW